MPTLKYQMNLNTNAWDKVDLGSLNLSASVIHNPYLLAAGAVSAEIALGSLSLINVLYVETNYDISIQFNSAAGTSINVTADKPLLMTGINQTKLYVTNSNASAASLYIFCGQTTAVPILAPTPATPAYYDLVRLGCYNVSDYGAVGDGLTDDTIAVNAAWAAVVAANGGTLCFPPGEFYCPNGLDFSAAAEFWAYSFRISGCSMYTSVIKTHDANISLDLAGRENLVIENLAIYDDGTTAKVGINRARAVTDAGTGNNHYYRNLYIHGFYSVACLYSIGSEVNSHYDCKFDNLGTGAAFYTGPTNDAGMVATQAYRAAASNTVQSFYGGNLWAVQGSAVSVGGICDNLQFYGTYLHSDYGHGLVSRYLVGVTTGTQGKVLLDGVRIETYYEGADGIRMEDGVTEFWGLYCIGVTFGLTGAAQVPPTGESTYDINFITAGGVLIASVIDRCWHGMTNITTGGLILQEVNQCHINLTDYNHAGFSHPTISIATGVKSSYIEAPSVTLGATCWVDGSKIIDTDYVNGIWREYFGPSSVFNDAVHDAYGSVPVLNQFYTEPVTVVEGSIAASGGCEGGASWDPLDNYQSNPYPCFWDGVRWRPMVPTTSRRQSSCGWRYTGANVNETVLHDPDYLTNPMVIPGNTFAVNASGNQVIKIRAGGFFSNNANEKTLRLRILQGAVNIAVVTSALTPPDANYVYWQLEVELWMASIMAVGDWGAAGGIRYSGTIAPAMVAQAYSGADALDFTADVEIRLTGQNTVASANDIACGYLYWEMATAY